MILVLVLFIILLILGIIENYVHLHNLGKIKLRILVNGTRGKTTVSKVIVQALNNKGIRTVGRTTGSEACYILPDNSVTSYKRKRAARITEMISFVRFAKKQNAECIVAECMALNPENQRLLSYKLVKPTHVAITNSYLDHIAEIGSDKETTQWVLSNSVYKSAVLVASEEEYQTLGNEFYLADDVFSEYAALPINRQSLNVAYQVLKLFGISKEETLKAAEEIIPDVGLFEKLAIGTNILYPNFSVNDYDSMKSVIERIGADEKVSLIFNSRADREYRIKTFQKALYENIERVEKVYVVGDYPKKVSRHIAHWCKVDIEAITSSDLIKTIEESDRKTFVGLGNIKGPGETIVRYFIEENK